MFELFFTCRLSTVLSADVCFFEIGYITRRKSQVAIFLLTIRELNFGVLDACYCGGDAGKMWSFPSLVRETEIE